MNDLDIPKRAWWDKRLIKGKSQISGWGIFTTEKIKSGETIMIWGGEVVEKEGFDENKYRYQTIVPISETHYLALPITDTEESLDEYLNHSCDPNTWLVNEITMVARRDIEPGEEITLDCVMWEDGLGDEEYTYEGTCTCGSSLCRKILTANDWKLPQLQERYAGHFSPYIMQRITTLKRHAKETSSD